MSYSTICTTCGAPDSVIGNSDNHGCSECCDTEGIIYWEDIESTVKTPIGTLVTKCPICIPNSTHNSKGDHICKCGNEFYL